MEVPMNERQAAIELEGVSKSYGRTLALSEIDMRVGRGEFIAITGKSGCGKSTLLNMVSGIDQPSRGAVRIGGAPLDGMNESAKARLRSREIGIVFQFFQLVPTLRAVENVMLPMSFSKAVPRGERRKVAMALLERAGIGGRASHFPSELSGGEQQRVAIARALANDPRIVIADEPTGNLDSATARDVLGILEGLSAEGRTVLIVTHDRELAELAHRVVVMSDGRIQA
jgi:putative ABC transport system ATP-binding protein